MEQKVKSTFDLETYKRVKQAMIATNDKAYGSKWQNSIYFNTNRIRNYTRKDIENIINSGSLIEQKRLSKDFFRKDGFYRKIIIYYATLLKYAGILIPNPSFGKNLETPFILKKYYNALDYIEKINIPTFCENCALKALIEGSYYGLILEQDKNTFSFIDLPGDYCRSNFKDTNGNDLIEFNVAYFNTIVDEDSKKEALKTYPKFITNHYKKYKEGKVINSWIFIPSELGICFQMFEGTPLFLNVILASIDYEDSVETERERDLEEIRKIIVQKIPHLNDGGLLFEPEEAQEIHSGTVGMLKGNRNVSVLTTYADVDAIVSKTSSDTASNNLEKMVNNIYNQAGVSGQLFASNSNLSLSTSIKNDAALMMCFAHKIERFITYIINKTYSNTNISFKYKFLPITHYNEEEYLDEALKLANAGYSFLVPAIAMDISQRDLINLKDLENDALKLVEKLIPLSSAFTQSSTGEGAGAPEKKPEDKAKKTVQNEDSLDKGGSN